MQKINRSLELPYSKEQMFALVNTIEDYPVFLPWCRDVQVHNKSEEEIKATLCVAKGPLKFDFTTINKMSKNELITLKLAKGPFRHLQGSWRFESISDDSCLVGFSISFQFANRLMSMALEPLFYSITSTLIESFSKRADELYAR